MVSLKKEKSHLGHFCAKKTIPLFFLKKYPTFAAQFNKIKLL